MAELEGKAEIMPAAPSGIGEVVQGDAGRYMIRISEFSPSGTKNDFAVALPTTGSWPDVMLRAAILKKTTFQSHDIPMIIHGVMYADRLGLDIMAGDVYLVAGRPAISNKAKIKMALATGNIEGMETAMKVLDAPFKHGPQGKDLECTVTIHVKGWKMPLTHTGKLSNWFKEKNPNWVTNPEHMLKLNTTAHACEYVAPGGTDSDEAPPVENRTGRHNMQASEMLTTAQSYTFPDPNLTALLQKSIAQASIK